MGAGFPDYFSTGAQAYARYRPWYPPELFARLAALAPGRQCCWDVATGTGQAARALVDHFDRVIATDASERQLAHAPAHPRIEYRVEIAERCSLADASVDLVTIAAGLHWLSLPAFYAEVRRVARPGAVIAAWSYGAEFGFGGELDRVVTHHVHHVLGPFWPEGHVHIRSAYRTLEFPFAELAMPPMSLTLKCTLDDVLGIIGTWSATGLYRAGTGRDPSIELAAELARVWGPEPVRTVKLPLFFRVGRVEADGASRSGTRKGVGSVAATHVIDLIEQLSLVASGFASIADIDGLAAELRSALSQVVDIEYSGLYLWDFAAQRLRLMYATGFTEAERAEAERTAWERHPGEVFRTQRMLLVPDVDADPEQRTRSSKRDFVIRSRLVMPIVFAGESLGVFLLASGERDPFSSEHIAVLRFMSRLAGVVYRQLLDREERRRAQLALADAARRIRLVVGTLPIALFVVDAAGRIALAEGTLVAALTREPLEGRPLAECLADLPQLRELLARARAGAPLPGKQVLRDQIVEAHAIANADGGATVMLHDVTAQQHNVDELTRLNGELLRALAATREKSQFLAAMSHELRTPVNAILGYAELAREDIDAGGSPDPEVIVRIQTSAQLLLRLINDNLDISKIEAGKMTLEIEDVELAPLLAALDVATQPVCLSSGNRARFVVEPGLERLRTDGTALRRILMNLLANAHKFTQGGEVTLTVATGRRDDRRVVVFAVEDTGIGMRADQLQRIFEPYAQAEPSTTRRYGGTGLGLTLSKQLARLLGGDIVVTSTEGVGSRFVVTLPAGDDAGA